MPDRFKGVELSGRCAVHELCVLSQVKDALSLLPVGIFFLSADEVFLWATGDAVSKSERARAIVGRRLIDVVPEGHPAVGCWRQALRGLPAGLLHHSGDRVYWSRFVPVQSTGPVAAVAATIDLTGVTSLPTGFDAALKLLRDGEDQDGVVDG